MVRKLSSGLAAALFVCLATPAIYAVNIDANCDGWQVDFNPIGRCEYHEVTVTVTAGGNVIDTQTGSDLITETDQALFVAGTFGPLPDGTHIVIVDRVFVPPAGICWDTTPTAEELAEATSFATEESFDVDCGETPPPPSGDWDPRTPGFWKNHEEVWADAIITIGDDDHAYDQDCLDPLFDLPTVGDIRIKFLHHLIAAKLNMMMGSADTVTNVPNAGDTIADTIAAADALVLPFLKAGDCPSPFLSGPAPKNGLKAQFNALLGALDAFNNSGEE